MDQLSADGNIPYDRTRTPSTVKKRSVVIREHKTSISLEDGFWQSLKEIASSQKTAISELVNAIDSEREQTNLSSAIRLFVLNYYRMGAAPAVHSR